MSRWLFASLVLGVSSLLAAATPLRAQEKTVEYRGIIREFDAKQGTITLFVPSREMRIAFNLGREDLPVTDVRGRPVKLSALTPGMRVNADVADEEEIVALHVESPYDIGTITGIDPVKRALQVKGELSHLVRTVPVPERTQLIVGKDEVTFDKLKAGMPVQLHWSLDRQTLLQVRAQPGGNAWDPFRRDHRVQGILLDDPDVKQRSVHILSQTKMPWIDERYEVDPDVVCVLMWQYRPLREVALGELPRWSRVGLLIDNDTKAAIKIEADLPETHRGKVTAIDPVKHVLTLAIDREEKEWSFVPDVKVYSVQPLADASLADVRPGTSIMCGLSPDRQTVLGILIFKQ